MTIQYIYIRNDSDKVHLRGGVGARFLEGSIEDGSFLPKLRYTH